MQVLLEDEPNATVMMSDEVHFLLRGSVNKQNSVTGLRKIFA